MKGRENITNLKKHRLKKNFSIGLLLVLLFSLYMVFIIFSYLTGKKTSVYEVREGSIVRDDVYTGLLVRQEQVVPAAGTGYINFFLPDSSKVRYGQNVYALSVNKLGETARESEGSETSDTAAETDNPDLTKAKISSLSRIHSFNEAYQPQNYKILQALDDELTGLLQGAGIQEQNTGLGNALSAGQEGLQVFTSQSDGVLSTYVDGMESVTIDNFTPDQVKKKDYREKKVENDSKVEEGTAAYKLVTSEDWSIVVPLPEDLSERLKEKTSVRIKILKDNAEIIGYFSVVSRGGEDFGVITFDNSMVRYVQDRYVSLELVLGDETGLKIPKSAVIEKNFYSIPKEYLTTGGNSAAYGVIVQTSGSASASGEFKKLKIFGEDSVKQVVYVSADDFPEGTVLIKPESSVTYTLSETEKLPGVYNVNQGYAVFKQVKILSENDEYYIVEDKSAYGLSNYDHIAQNGKKVKENEVIAQ